MKRARSIRNLGGIVVLAVGLATLGSVASAATLAVGTAMAARGDSVSIPVTLTASVDCTAAEVRVEYDPNVLQDPSASPGPLMAAGHVQDSYSPAAGRLNACVCSTTGAPAFTAQSGILFYLTFTIKADAPLGASNITITTQGVPALYATDLVDTSGAFVSHTATGGSVTVTANSGIDSWREY